MKDLTFEEAKSLLTEVGHMARVFVKVPVLDQQGYEIEKREVTILDNGMCYDRDGSQIGASNNEQNAETALSQIEREFGVYSSYFNYATGSYKIV